MKITIWIRTDENEKKTTIRTDYKYESRDTPMDQRVGRKILNALEGESS